MVGEQSGLIWVIAPVWAGMRVQGRVGGAGSPGGRCQLGAWRGRTVFYFLCLFLFYFYYLFIYLGSQPTGVEMFQDDVGE